MTAEESAAWGADAFAEVYDRIERAGARGARVGRCSPAGFFELERFELTAFVPVPRPVEVGGRIETVIIPAT